MLDEPEASERFRTIYDANYSRLVGYAMRRVSSPEDAADAVAETFLIAWRRLDQVPVGVDARLWLYGTARRVLANQRRAGLRRTRLSERLAVELSTATVNPTDGRDESAAAAHAFRRLSRSDRDLLGLVAWEGLTPSELGSVLGCSANAAKIRVHRARRRFARGLGGAAEAKPRPTSGHPPHRGATVLPEPEETR